MPRELGVWAWDVEMVSSLPLRSSGVISRFSLP